MPSWTPEQYEQYRRKSDAARLRALNPKSAKGNALERTPPREGQGSNSAAPRYRIRFTIYSVRPADWDGYDIKGLQDLLVHAGFLYDDDWTRLQGEVASRKAHSKAEERTEIVIEELI